MSVGSVVVNADGTITKSGLAANYYDAIAAQEAAATYIDAAGVVRSVLPDRNTPSATYQNTLASWQSRIDAAMLKVHKGWARQANALAQGLPAVAFVELAVDTTKATNVASNLLSQNLTTTQDNSFITASFTASGRKDVNAATVFFRLSVDGITFRGCEITCASSYSFNAACTMRAPVSAGNHTAVLDWRTNVGAVTIFAGTVTENHASLLAQETT